MLNSARKRVGDGREREAVGHDKWEKEEVNQENYGQQVTEFFYYVCL